MMAITQKDIHNHIVENCTPLQKAYISMACNCDPIKMHECEQAVANVINNIIGSMTNSGTDYLNKKINGGE